ncbi:Snx41p KNAG_0B03660 [Huiozyma naganishii CBS 8797]|uniref:PX domain-containing protein n=1 Tax=Huiozyma naganishii (strain ATCC MYA-139 / BCRC 22969 / CBS 8797 / KCTC 17520 / NBRC 10181 / NCYC 3082 / Yp74L-3) TaxID=1071383 RepID=J7RGZ7_HUIN7|nr:hypothetical protein KNAG_0B03660 [Kazachstania naganishii CBS 8797]CCK68808.1 hypothetical protein KNAG_0B03660 [Kazachstania naganishii CBS 8797]
MSILNDLPVEGVIPEDDEEEQEEEEDNNPFAGTAHMFASGVASVPDHIATGSAVRGTVLSAGAPQYLYDEDEVGDEVAAAGSADPTADLKRYDGDTPDVSSSDSSRGSTHQGSSTISPHSKYEPYETLTMSMAVPPVDNQPLDSLDGTERISIVDSGDFKDPWGKHAIGYVIRTAQGGEVIRRYSEFASLHQVLMKLLPTIVIPPIPSKHPLLKYFLNPINAQNDAKIIEKRKRRFVSFLNECNRVAEIRSHIVFQKFLDPEYNWKDVLNSPPVTVLPLSNLLAPPLNPTKPSPLHILLPSPRTLTKVKPLVDRRDSDTEKEFALYEEKLARYMARFHPLHASVKQTNNHVHTLSSQIAELGAYYNAFSLENRDQAAGRVCESIEKIGHSFDVTYVSLEMLAESVHNLVEEPLDDIVKYLQDSKRVIVFKDLKYAQRQIIKATIKKRTARFDELAEFGKKLKKLDSAVIRDVAASSYVEPAESTSPESPTSPTNLSSSVVSHTEQVVQFQLQRNKRRLGKNAVNKRGQVEPEFLTTMEREEETKRLARELSKLRECERLIDRDIEQVNASALNSLKSLVEHIDSTAELLLKSITRAIIDWIKECLKAWQTARASIGDL